MTQNVSLIRPDQSLPVLAIESRCDVEIITCYSSYSGKDGGKNHKNIAVQILKFIQIKNLVS